MWIVPFLLTACWAPRETGPKSMVGHVVDASGAPLAQLKVESVESEDKTDAEGSFAVNYKEPSQYVFFTHENLWFKRSYHASDEGTVVRIETPELTSTPYACQTDAPCQMSLVWDVGEHLSATLRHRCDPDALPVELTVPASGVLASATCRETPTSDEVPLHLWTDEDMTRVTPPPVSLQIDITSPDTELPENCVVTANGEPAFASGLGTYRADVFGRTMVQVTCDGIATAPRPYVVRQSGRVSIPWRPETPVLDLLEIAPGVQSVWLRAVKDRAVVWRIRIEPFEPSRFRIPDLPRGEYVLAMGDAEEAMPKVFADPSTEEGVVQLVKLPYTDDDGEHLIVGTLIVRESLPADVLPTRLDDHSTETSPGPLGQ